MGSAASTDEREAADDEGADALRGTPDGRRTRTAATTTDAATAAINAAGTWARGTIRLSTGAVPSGRDRRSRRDIAADLDRLHAPTDDRHWRGMMGG